MTSRLSVLLLVGATLLSVLVPALVRADSQDPLDLVRAEARKRFDESSTAPRNTLAENRLIEDAILGQVSDGKAWGEDRAIRADRIAWLCTAPKIVAMVTHNGIRLRNVNIVGGLDLANARIPFPLSIEASTIPRTIDLSGAELVSLTLDGSTIGAFYGRSMRVTVDVQMRRGFQASGTTDLSNVRIGGDLDLTGGRFLKADGVAIYGDQMSLDRDLVMGNWYGDRDEVLHQFRAEGQVRWSGATINGNINGTGGQFSNRGQVAIDAAGMTVKGNAYFTSKNMGRPNTVWFRVEGLTELSNSRIEGDLHCAGGQFDWAGTESGNAIRAHGLKVGGDVHFDHGFRSLGRVDLTVGQIGGSLDCRYGNFVSTRDTATDARGIALDVSSASVGHDVILGRGRFVSHGVVRLEGTSIGGQFDCRGGTFENPQGPSIEARWMTVKGNVSLETFHYTEKDIPREWRFQSVGLVNLSNARIGGNLDCRGGRFEPSMGTPTVLNASGSLIEGDANFRDHFEPRGTLDLSNAKINRYLSIRTIPEKADWHLDLSSTTTGGLDHHPDSWPGEKKLAIDGFTYEFLRDSIPPSSGKTWIDWIGQHEKYSSGPYEQLAAVLLKAGRTDEAKEVLIRKEQRKWEEQLRREKEQDPRAGAVPPSGKSTDPHLSVWDKLWYGSFWDRLWYNVIGPMIDYGYKPLNSFLSGLVFILIGYLIFWKAARHDVFVAKTAGESGTPPRFKPLIYSIDLFIPVVSFHEQDNWLLELNRGPGRPFPMLFLFRLYWMAHIVMGWTITSLLVAGLLGLIRHD